MKPDKIDKIKELLERYYQGVSTPEEEKILLRYFMEEKIPESLEEERIVFLGLHGKAAPQVPPSLEKDLCALIDTLEREESRVAKMPDAAPSIPQFRWRSFAASIILLIGLASWGLLTYSEQPRVMTETYTDPEEAYKETERILSFVSEKLNRGIGGIERTDEELSRTRNVIRKQIQYE